MLAGVEWPGREDRPFAIAEETSIFDLEPRGRQLPGHSCSDRKQDQARPSQRENGPLVGREVERLTFAQNFGGGPVSLADKGEL